MPRDYKRDDLTGQVFGRLTALSLTKIRHNAWGWVCRCECGATIVRRGCLLKSGQVRSCGCLKRDGSRERFTTHGMRRTRVYAIWCAMFKRCENPNEPCYRRYGGRGIKVCERWHSFEAFLEDMGEPPSGRYSIDRFPDKDGDYEAGNCRWASDVEQARNKRNNHLLEWNGETKTVAEWSEITGIHVQTILYRLRSGWSIGETLGERPRVAMTLTHEGRTMTLVEWSKATGIPHQTLRKRFMLGWPTPRILAEPPSRPTPR